MNNCIVVNKAEDFPFRLDDVVVITANDYLTQIEYAKQKKLKVYNLCRSYRYQALGYYVSLLAAARGHKVIPDVLTIQDTKTQAIIKLKSEEFEVLMQKALENIKTEFFNLNVYWGQTVDASLSGLGNAIFAAFPSPLLTAFFQRNGARWKLQDVDPISTRDLPDNHPEYVEKFAGSFFGHKHPKQSKKKKFKYRMAILANPAEAEAPSNPAALQQFRRAANRQGFDAEMITRDDNGRLGEFDALFIRETTQVNHHTYRMARKAEVEGLVVIDDPESIMRCSNKVYLAELLKLNGIAGPKTIVLNKELLARLGDEMALPVVLKQPDSCFSQGVVKASTPEELLKLGKNLLSKSELILAQEFLPTSYDWRIGIINGEPIFACQYFMADDHWQIMNWEKKKGKGRYGSHKTIPWQDAPAHIVDAALKSASLIGNGLYGVDVKDAGGVAYVIEVNDNPSIETRVEDQVLGAALYDKIISVFRQRLE